MAVADSLGGTDDLYVLAGCVGAFLGLLVGVCWWCRRRSAAAGDTNDKWYVQSADGTYGEGRKKKKGGKGRKKKKELRKKQKAKAALEAQAAAPGSDAQETGSVSSLGSEGNVQAIDRDVSDQTLLNTFISVLSEGLTITMHGSKGRPKQIKLWLEGDYTLKWASTKALVKKKKKMNLHDVLFVEVGKQTTNFARATARAANEDLCFSLVTQTTTLDLESSSKMEREAMTQGFSMILNDLKANEDKLGV